MTILKMGTTLVAASIVLATANTALADNGRFVMEKSDQGYVRMDTQTGAMSICETKQDQVVCKMAADERAAFDEDIKALEDRIAALEQRLDDAPISMFREPNGLPSQEEFERGLGYMEQFMRRFMGLAKELEEDRT